MQEIFNALVLHPKRLFLIDGLGALVTAFILFSILRPLNEYFGMPKSILTILSIIGLVFCVYSSTCFLFAKNNWKPFLKGIIIGNLIYCFLTMGLIIYYYPQLTILGFTYFFLEMLTIGGLVNLEVYILKISKRRNR